MLYGFSINTTEQVFVAAELISWLEPSIAASVPKVRCHQEQPSTAAAWTGSSADQAAVQYRTSARRGSP
jgi:hypothetical protein